MKHRLKMFLLTAVLLLMASCDETVSILNYPGAVVTKKTMIEGVCRINLLIHDETCYQPYRYREIIVTEYEFNRYEIGDTIPGEVKMDE